MNLTPRLNRIAGILEEMAEMGFRFYPSATVGGTVEKLVECAYRAPQDFPGTNYEFAVEIFDFTISGGCIVNNDVTLTLTRYRNRWAYEMHTDRNLTTGTLTFLLRASTLVDEMVRLLREEFPAR